MDENNRRMATNIRLQLTNLAESFAQSGKSARGLQVLERLIEATPSRNVPYDRIMLPSIELLSEFAQDANLTEAQRKSAGALAKQVGSELFAMLSGDVDYFFSLDEARYAAASNEIQMAMAVSQRVSGALSDALPDDAEVQAMADAMSQLLSDRTARQRGPLSDPAVFDPDAR